MVRIVALWVAILAVGSFGFTADTSSPSAKADEIKARFEAEDYGGVLRESAHLLSSGKKGTEGVDLHAINLFRAESLLQLKQTDAAAQAFHQAAKATDDPGVAAVDLATEMLVHRSRQQQYTPKIVAKNEKPAPIDILAAGPRKQAIAALFNDEWATVAPKLKSAQDGTSLVLIASTIKTINAQQLPTLDLAAHNNGEQTKQAIETLRKHAQELMSKALERMGKQEQEIIADANEIVHQQVMMPDGRGGYVPQDLPRRRGLQGTSRADLESMKRLAAQIAEAAKELLADLGDKTAAADLTEQAQDIVQRADKALRADYTRA
jgi:hypothetical protein